MLVFEAVNQVGVVDEGASEVVWAVFGSRFGGEINKAAALLVVVMSPGRQD